VPDGVVNDRWLAQEGLFKSLRDEANRASFNAMMKARIQAASGPQPTPPPPHCDFRTVEYGMSAIPTDSMWEACRGLSLAFGHNAQERPEDFLDAQQLIDLYKGVRAGGGNLLINVGPRADASIPDVQDRPLRALGAMMQSA